MESRATFRRARLRQRVADVVPRALSDSQWDELFAAMTCDRDRALLLCYVSSGARANELLGVQVGDVDWGGLKIYVVSKGTGRRGRQSVQECSRQLDNDCGSMSSVGKRRNHCDLRHSGFEVHLFA
jgi:integrase